MQPTELLPTAKTTHTDNTASMPSPLLPSRPLHPTVPANGMRITLLPTRFTTTECRLLSRVLTVVMFTCDVETWLQVAGEFLCRRRLRTDIWTLQPGHRPRICLVTVRVLLLFLVMTMTSSPPDPWKLPETSLLSRVIEARCLGTTVVLEFAVNVVSRVRKFVLCFTILIKKSCLREAVALCTPLMYLTTPPRVALQLTAALAF